MKDIVKYFKSRTVTFNSAVIALTTLTVAIETHLGYLREAVPPEYWPYVVGGIFLSKTFADLYLRKVTTKPLDERKHD